MFKVKTIRNSYFIGLFSITFILLIILTSFFIYQRYREFTDEAEIQKNDFVMSQKEIIKNEVDRAIDFIEFNKAKIAERVEAGEKLEDVKKEIQEDIIKWIQEIRFDEGGYIFISTYEGIVLAHYRPEHIGNNLWDLTDPNGIKIHQTILKVGTQPGGGYMEYIGTKNPVTGKPGEKVTFARSIDEWRWLVGAGVYLVNIEVVIAANREQFIKRIKSHVIYAILIFLIITALAILIINSFSQRISKQFNLLIHYFQKSATTYEKIDREKLPYNEFKVLSDSVNKMVTQRKQAEQQVKQGYKKLQRTMEATINTISKIIEARDPYTAGHQNTVSQFAVAIAKEMKLPEDKIEGMRIAALVHDIGKINIPAEILSKPSKLNEMEFNLIKNHPKTGYNILKTIDFPWPVARIVLQHHERLDGSGYPQGLKGDKTLLEAKIIGTADVVEAMASHRPYRPALGIDKALKEISQNKGILYDPEVADACLKLFKEKDFEFKL